MPTVGTVSEKRFPQKVAKILNGITILNLDGHSYARFVARMTESDQVVLTRLSDMGLRTEIVTPDAVARMRAFKEMFTRRGAMQKDCLAKMSASLQRLGLSPEKTSALSYLLNPNSWKPRLMGIFNKPIERGEEVVLGSSSKIKIDRNHLGWYNESELKAAGLFKPSPEQLAVAAQAKLDRIKGLRDSIAFFKAQGDDVSVLEKQLADALGEQQESGQRIALLA